MHHHGTGFCLPGAHGHFHAALSSVSQVSLLPQEPWTLRLHIKDEATGTPRSEPCLKPPGLYGVETESKPFPLLFISNVVYSPVQFSRSVVSDSLRPHESQHLSITNSRSSPRLTSMESVMLDSILKSRDITLPTKFCLVKAMVFPIVMYGCESWTRRLSAEELMLLNCGVEEDSWESLGLQGDPTSPS